MSKDNWVKETNQLNVHDKAKKLLEGVKDNKKGKKFKLVKIDDRTYKEVEIK